MLDGPCDTGELVFALAPDMEVPARLDFRPILVAVHRDLLASASAGKSVIKVGIL